MSNGSRFRFLNEEGDIVGAEDWNDSRRPKLWLYNLHYFDDLTSSNARSRGSELEALINRWIRDNPPGSGVGWEPFPTSLRLVNWIKWALVGNSLDAEQRHSLAVQTRWLTKRVERHLGGNHVLVNAKALFFAGSYFSGSEADGWRTGAMNLLGHELSSQILHDGAHFERSPMYHAQTLEDILDLINAARALQTADEAVISSWCALAARMLGWLRQMTHRDGEIAFFNDAAFDVASTLADLSTCAARLGIESPPPAPLGDSGYLRMERGDALLIADVALIGPDHQPGHGHADTLSFEFSIGEQRVFVNSGTSTYATGPQRQFERSTAAHNTVEIDDADSSEVWAGFRVARRARPFDVEFRETNSALILSAAHDGYWRARGKPTHRRSWRLENNLLRVSDRIEGSFLRAVARFHLHPSLTVCEGGVLRLPVGTETKWRVQGGTPRVVDTRWYPEFGRAVSNKCIEVTLIGNELEFELRW
jgi:uncharacterized heparinase superfamily protein